MKSSKEGGKIMYRSSGNYEAFAKKKLNNADEISVYLIDSG